MHSNMIIRELAHRQIEAWVDTLIAARAAGAVREVQGHAYPYPDWDGQEDGRIQRLRYNRAYRARLNELFQGAS